MREVHRRCRARHRSEATLGDRNVVEVAVDESVDAGEDGRTQRDL